MSKLTMISIFLGLSVCFMITAAREGRISGADRINDPEISRCLNSKSCPVTMDFRPTCASDGRTYANTRSIHCLNECLKPEEKLEIVSGGYCKDDAPTER